MSFWFVHEQINFWWTLNQCDLKQMQDIDHRKKSKIVRCSFRRISFHVNKINF